MALLNLLLHRNVEIYPSTVPGTKLQVVAVKITHGWFKKRTGFVNDIQGFLEAAGQVCQAEDVSQGFTVSVPLHQKIEAFIAKHKAVQDYTIPAWAFPDAKVMFAQAGKSVIKQTKNIADKLMETQTAMLQMEIPKEKVEAMFNEAIEECFGSKELFNQFSTFKIPEEKRTLH